MYFALGVGVILIGSILPSLRDANALSYGQSGNLLSIQSIGFLLIGLITGYAVLRLGMKRAYILLTATLPLGLFMLIRGGSFLFLAVAMFLVGIAKGSVTDYNNRVMSDYAEGNAAPLNSLHVFFAIGACIAPFIALFMDSTFRNNGWLAALTVSAVLAVLAVAFAFLVKMDLGKPAEQETEHNTRQGTNETDIRKSVFREDKESPARPANKPMPESGTTNDVSVSASLDFFREPLFLWTLLIGICNQALEGSLMGWLTTFYLESGIVQEQTAQLITSLLWFSFLVGRLACILIAAKWHPSRMLLVMGCGTALFMVLLVISGSAPLLLFSTVGLGLCLSGMYGTAVSNASSVFSRYSSSMGLFVSIAGIGGAAAPALIGWFSDMFNVRIGFCVLIAASLILTFSVLMNSRLPRHAETA